MSISADVAITTVTCILIIISIVGNCFVCAVVMKNRDMRTPLNYLLVNLAVADTTYATFMIPAIILSYVSHPHGVAGRVLCSLLTVRTLCWVGAYTSVFTLVAIAIERYIAVLHPYGNKRKLTMRKLKVVIPGSWICGLIINFLAFLFLDFVKERNRCSIPIKWMRRLDQIVFYVFILLSCTLLVVLYSRIVYTLWFKREDDIVLTHQQQAVLKMRKRVTFMVVIVSAIFVISYGTDVLMHILEDEFGVKLFPHAITIAHTVIMFNSAVNPYAYALVNQRFRVKMKEMICCNSSSLAPAREQQNIEMANNNGTQTSNISGTPTSSTE